MFSFNSLISRRRNSRKGRAKVAILATRALTASVTTQWHLRLSTCIWIRAAMKSGRTESLQTFYSSTRCRRIPCFTTGIATSCRVRSQLIALPSARATPTTASSTRATRIAPSPVSGTIAINRCVSLKIWQGSYKKKMKTSKWCWGWGRRDSMKGWMKSRWRSGMVRKSGSKSYITKMMSLAQVA